MKRDAWIASWEENPEDGDAARGYGSILHIYPYPANDGKPGTVAICVNDERFDAVTVATLDEIIGHLTALRAKVFGAPTTIDWIHLVESALASLDLALGPESPLGKAEKGALQGAFVHIDGAKLVMWQRAARAAIKEARGEVERLAIQGKEKLIEPLDTVEGLHQLAESYLQTAESNRLKSVHWRTGHESLRKAITDCLEYFNGHQHEMGERAVTALQFLEDAIEKDADDTKGIQ